MSPQRLPRSLIQTDVSQLRTYALVAVILAGILTPLHRMRQYGREAQRYAAWSLLASVFVLVADVITSNGIEKRAITHYISQYTELASSARARFGQFSSFEKADLASVVEGLTRLSGIVEDPALRTEIRGYLAGAELLSGRDSDSARRYAELLNDFPEARTHENVKSLKWALYRYKAEYGEQAALALASELMREFPAARVSRIWIAVAPLVWEHIEAGDPRGSIGEAEFDRPLIERITAGSTDDPDYYLGLFLTEKYDQLIQLPSDTPFRDWALYRRGQSAFDSRAFSDSIPFLQRFRAEYPQHQWYDDAVFLLGSSYHAIGEQESAVDVLLPERDKLTEISRSVRLLLLAIVDIGFGSERLAAFIHARAGALSRGDERFLMYCQAEQLFKERHYGEAASVFGAVRSGAPDSTEGEFASNNLRLIKELESLKSADPGLQAVRLAGRYIRDSGMESGDGDLPQRYLVYNDLYRGERFHALQLLEQVDPQSIHDLNDYWQAIDLLDEFTVEYPTSAYRAQAMYTKTQALYVLSYEHALSPERLRLGSGFFVGIGTMAPDADVVAYRDAREALLNDLTSTAVALADSSPDGNYGPAALELAGVAYGSAFAAWRMDQYAAESERIMLELARRFPTNHIANNALMFAARLDLQRSNVTDTQLRSLLRARAQAILERIVEQYPGKRSAG